MGFSLPNGSLPLPPPPNLMPMSPMLMSAPVTAQAMSTRTFLLLIGNIKDKDISKEKFVITGTVEIYSENATFGQQIYTNKTIEFDIPVGECISLYVYTQGQELTDCVNIDKLHWLNKKITLSYVEIIQ